MVDGRTGRKTGCGSTKCVVQSQHTIVVCIPCMALGGWEDFMTQLDFRRLITWYSNSMVGAAVPLVTLKRGSGAGLSVQDEILRFSFMGIFTYVS